MPRGVRDQARGGSNGAGPAIATVGVAAFAIVCCVGLPVLAALVGSVAIGTLLGGAAGIVAAAVIVGAVAIRLRSRRASCRIDGESKGS
jgi:hypothetical protein